MFLRLEPSMIFVRGRGFEGGCRPEYSGLSSGDPSRFHTRYITCKKDVKRSAITRVLIFVA